MLVRALSHLRRAPLPCHCALALLLCRCAGLDELCLTDVDPGGHGSMAACAEAGVRALAAAQGLPDQVPRPVGAE